jgi:predicted Zn-dependent protease
MGDEQAFGTISRRAKMIVRRRRFTLMPAIALAALGLMVALPTLSSMRLYAATAQRYTSVTVHPGDTLWSIASSHTRPSSDVQEAVDRITAANHLTGGTLQPGEHLRIPSP